MAKTIFLIFFFLFVIISMYILTQNLIISITIGLLCSIIFITIFHSEVYRLRYSLSLAFRRRVSFNPFEDIVFWYNKNDIATLYLSNRKDLNHVAIRIFQIDVIPENVHSAVHQFVKALSSKNSRISYSYQIIQKPIIPIFQKNSSREIVLKSMQSRVTSIYFTLFYHTKGILSTNKIDRMQYFIIKYSNTLKSNFVSWFHHFQASLLSGTTLINAVRSIFIQNDSNNFHSENKKKILKRYNSYTLNKLLLCVVLILYVDYILFFMNLLIIFIIVINLSFIISLVLIWWRSLLFQFTKSRLLKEDDILVENPFNKVLFYRIKEFPYSLFLHIDNRLLIGLKMVNLKYVYQTPFCLLGRFIESLNNHKISFSYTLKNQPLSYYDFYKHGLKNLNEINRSLMLWKKDTKIKDGIDAERWLGYRYGMWYSMLTMSINVYRFADSIEDTHFSELENELITQMDTMRGAFNINFQSYEVEDLKTSNLISGFIFSMVKNNLIQLNGTHLNYVMLQGANMYPLSNIADILKKGTPTKIAAEFNTPLYLENYITVGHTINTEVLEPEVPVGFTLEQLKNLLIVNGTSEKRDAISMKIVSELIKANVPSLIFDFTGDWAKLYNYFEDSKFKKDILYFKYGSAFIIDPTKSDVPYDPQNTEYLKYVYDAFALALKKDERTVEMFRNIIQKNPDMDLGSICIALQNQSEWEKTSISDSLLSLFSDFTQDDLTFFQPIHEDNIVANYFVKNKKTVIVDLSVLRELKKKIFLTFIILAKIIHYVKNETDYYKKFIVVPYIDIFFDAYFLDLKRNYDKVDIFLNPLIEKNFGLIFSAHQIHYLHTNFLLYFNNLIALKTTDNRDISMLRNFMNLQELEGVGYYTRSRNQTYQILYLKNMKDNEVLIRRDDIDQPFPAYIDWKEIQEKDPLSYEDIVIFMKRRGFDLENTERKILENAQKTLFEIDLGHYIIYLKEIIKFLDEIKTIDQIGNLYKHKLKTQLKEIIYPKISQKTSKKEHIKRVRDELLNTLIKHGYLVEDHPLRASGSEALRTSYSVGERYREALDDYFQTKGRTQTDMQVQILEKATERPDLENIFKVNPRKYIVPENKLKLALVREYSDFNYDIFTIYSYINREDYKNALKIEHGIIKKYLMNVYRHFYNVESVVIADLNEFLTVLEDIKGFPFSKQELIDYIDKYQVLNLDGENLELLAKEIYQFIYNFLIKIQYYIYEEEKNNEQ